MDRQLTQKSHTAVVGLYPCLLTPLQVTNTRVGDSLDPRLFFLDLSLRLSLPSLEKILQSREIKSKTNFFLQSYNNPEQKVWVQGQGLDTQLIERL